MNKKIIEEIRKYIEEENNKGKELTRYILKANHVNYFNKSRINVELEQNKEIILQEETHLELGGMSKKSFSIILPLENLKLIKDGKITLLGPEIYQITDSSVDFGLFVLIGVKKVSEKEYYDLRSLRFVSNGIEGFSIRTIPRKFWSRISTDLIKKKFSFELLANAIYHLYKKKFKDLINKIEIFIISTYSDSINEFIKLSSSITSKFREERIAKIDEWRKRINCEYDWGCEICPYQEECYDIKKVLVERERIG